MEIYQSDNNIGRSMSYLIYAVNFRGLDDGSKIYRSITGDELGTAKAKRKLLPNNG